MERLPLPKALESLAWLAGTWRIDNYGNGKYPTMKDFKYYEEISFECIGQPMFNYTARSYSVSEPKKPMAISTGFLKVNPETNKVFLILAHNFGLTTIEEGEVINNTINLKSTDIVRKKESKLPQVTQIRREFKLDGNRLEHVLYMATSNTPVLTEHLRATWHPETGTPMHRETGFLQILPGTNKIALSLIDNIGLFTVEQGELMMNDTKTFDLKSTNILATDASIPNFPTLTETRRVFKFDGDSLELIFYMATSKTPELTEHLRAKYKKIV